MQTDKNDGGAGKYAGHTPAPWATWSTGVYAITDETEITPGMLSGARDQICELSTLEELHDNEMDAAKASLANARLIADAPMLLAQRDALVGALEEITESYDAGRCDGHLEPYPAHDADTMFGIALAALASVKEQQ